MSNVISVRLDAKTVERLNFLGENRREILSKAIKLYYLYKTIDVNDKSECLQGQTNKDGDIFDK